jgi:hypothetical protein
VDGNSKSVAFFALSTVPKNIKGVKGDDRVKLLISSTNVFYVGTLWNTFSPFFGFFSGDLEQFGTLKKRIWNTLSYANYSISNCLPD